ncbi:MAG: glycosyltransferase family 2 protein [Sphingomonadales bacterium]|nr:glycosyltransferase family 2 protein [Sphingomonadales bacterium]
MNDTTGDRTPRVAVIVPAWNAASTIEPCLRAIAAQTCPPVECVLFDDGSTDETPGIAERYGVRVIGHAGQPIGPAAGRNRAAAAVDADLLMFVDADVVLAPDALEKLVAPFASPEVMAAFGSYDASPPSRRLSSVYVNLRHHFTHQRGEREAQTFWSGIGMVRREAFLALGGFDADLFPWPSIEDVELGARIVASGGRIRLVPEAQGGHYKDWRLKQLLHADIFRRALPWSLLIAQGKAPSNALNVSHREGLKSILSGCILLALLIGLFQPPALLGAAALFILYCIANRDFLSLVWHKAGLVAALVAAMLHCLYHFYAAAVFALVSLAARLGFMKPTRHNGATSRRRKL